ncbi:MAG: HAD family hydrolase [Candidatus Hodarchaeales archaeon]|jgi:FMN phosphatase YigB (HAD superfamily)
MIRAISFDFDDTLAGYFPPVHQAFNTLLRRKKIKIREDKVIKAFLEVKHLFRSDPKLERKLLDFARFTKEERMAFYTEINFLRLQKIGLKLEPAELEDLASYITSTFRNVSTLKIFEDVPEALLELKLFHEKLLVYIISGNRREHIQDLLAKEGLIVYIKKIFTTEKQGELSKRDLFHIGLKKAGIKPKQWLHVGDDFYSDYLFPSEIGIRTLLLHRPKLLHLPIPENKKDTVQIIENLHQIYDYL